MKLLKFTALWCRWCRAYAPAIEKFVNENNIEIISIDVDERPDLAEEWHVTTIPTVVLIDKHDIEVTRLDDVIDEDTLKTLLPYLK